VAVRKKTRKNPVVISIRSQGVIIDAKIDRSFAAALAERLPDFSAPKDASPHDFEVVRRVIDQGDLAVLQAVADLVNTKIRDRQSAS
jgi:hypothetical protein